MASPSAEDATSLGAPVELDGAVAAEIVAYCLRGAPDEACGLLAGRAGSTRIDRWFPTANIAASARRYVVDPADHLKADLRAEAEGREIVGVFHSHTHTDAYPSVTDVAEAPDPAWHYLIVSLRAEVPSLRAFRITDGAITEEPVTSI